MLGILIKKNATRNRLGRHRIKWVTLFGGH